MHMRRTTILSDRQDEALADLLINVGDNGLQMTTLAAATFVI